MPNAPPDLFTILQNAMGSAPGISADTPWEKVLLLLLQTAAKKGGAEKALAGLREEGLVSPDALARLSLDELAEIIRPAGAAPAKAGRVLAMARLIVDRFDGDAAALFALDLDSVRTLLLELNGVGPETADRLLLFAGGFPVLPLDAGLQRIALRHGWVPAGIGYEEGQQELLYQLPAEVDQLQQLSELLTEVGQKWCRKQPQCAGCPLESCLLPTGPVELYDTW